MESKKYIYLLLFIILLILIYYFFRDNIRRFSKIIGRGFEEDLAEAIKNSLSLNPSVYEDEVYNRMQAISGDGNCLFNSVSKSLFADEDQARELRTIAVNEVAQKYLDNTHVQRGRMGGIRYQDRINPDYHNLAGYIDLMSRDTVYGTEIEFEVLAQYFGFTGRILDGAKKIINGEDDVLYETDPYGPQRIDILKTGEHFYL